MSQLTDSMYQDRPAVIPAGFSAVNVKYLYQLGASGGFTAKVARPYVYKV